MCTDRPSDPASSQLIDLLSAFSLLCHVHELGMNEQMISRHRKGVNSSAHSLNSQVGNRSASHCLSDKRRRSTTLLQVGLHYSEVKEIRPGSDTDAVLPPSIQSASRLQAAGASGIQLDAVTSEVCTPSAAITVRLSDWTLYGDSGYQGFR